MAKFTIQDLLTKALDIAVDMQSNKVNKQNPYVTIVTEVPATLDKAADFDFNGKIFASDTYANILEKYGTLDLKELGDTRVKNLKVCWGTTPVDKGETSEIFTVFLTIRVLEIDGDEVLKFTTLRNNYGPSLQESYLTK